MADLSWRESELRKSLLFLLCRRRLFLLCRRRLFLLCRRRLFLLLLHVLLLVLLLIVMFPLMCFIADTLLASLHADVNQADNDGWTPLKVATEQGKEDTAAVLRSLGGRM